MKMDNQNEFILNQNENELDQERKCQLLLIKEIVFYKKRNKEIFETIKILKKRKSVFEVVIPVLIWFLIFFLISTLKTHAQFVPSDVSDMVFFVESADLSTTNHVATCETDFCLNHPNSESAIITEQYCDVTNSCGNGCVRRWLDQSSYVPSGGFNPPEYTSGRNFGQDDKEKPCFIPNAINGHPSIKGGGAYGDLGDIDGDGDTDYEFPQDKYLEIEGSDIISLSGAFSIFLLAKPIDQTSTGDWFYFGQAASFAKHRVSNNTIAFRVNPNPQVIVNTPNAIQMDTWQLIEIHRDASNNVTSFVNGVDTSVSGANTGSGTFRIGYLLSVFKTGISNGVVSMHGEVASFLVYNKQTSSSENSNIRDYFDQNYLGNTLKTPSLEVADIKVFPNPMVDKIEITCNIGDKSNIPSQDYPKFYDILGKEISSVIEETTSKATRNFNITFNSSLAKGVYWMKFGNKTIMLIKN